MGIGIGIIIIIKAMRLTWYKCKSTARPRYNTFHGSGHAGKMLCEKKIPIHIKFKAKFEQCNNAVSLL